MQKLHGRSFPSLPAVNAKPGRIGLTLITSRANTDIAVIGNGVIGQSLAMAVKQAAPEARVTVIGPANRVGGASPAAGAMLGCFGEVTKYTFASQAGREKFGLSLEAHAMWPAFLAKLADAVDGSLPDPVMGTYVVLNARSGWLDSENFDSLVQALDAHGAPYEFVEGVPGLDPSPDARPLRTVFLPEEGAIDARALLRGLEEANAALGVEAIDDSVSAILCKKGQLSGVGLLKGDAIRCGTAVVAAGAASASLLESVLPGQIQPVLAGSGLALITERVMGAGFHSVVRTVNRAGSCGLHVLPLGNGAEYFGATNVIFREPEFRPHLGIWNFLAGCVIDQLDRLACYSRVTQVLLGNRPVPLDTFPLLGPTDVGGLHVVTGTYRDGLHAAPAIADHAAALIVRGVNDFPKAFDPMRRPIVAMSVDASVDEFVHQMVSSAYEGGLKLSPFMTHRDLDAIYRARAIALYEQLGLQDGLHPDILNYLVLSRKNPSDVTAVERYLRP